MTGFVTLVHNYIQVTARLINYILFIRALGVSMWKQSWLKCFNLNIPLFLIPTNFIKEIKNIVNSNITSQNAKIASQNQNFFLPAAGYIPCFAEEIIAELLCDDNSNTELLVTFIFNHISSSLIMQKKKKKRSLYVTLLVHKHFISIISYMS